MKNINTDDLLIFVLVAETGSFTQAAEQMQTSHSFISKRVKRLEADLSSQLIYRSTRRLSLTAAGEALFEHGKDIRNRINDAVADVSGYNTRLSGRLRISVPTISGEILLAQTIASFCRLYPDIRIEMSLNNELVDIIGEGYDLAIRTANLVDSSLIARHFLDSRWLVCASPDYLASQGCPKQPEELTLHNCLTYSFEQAGINDWLFKRDKMEFSVAVSGAITSDNAVALKQAALSGFGLIYVPLCLVHQELKEQKLMEILTPYTAKRLGVYGLYPKTEHPDRKVQTLVNYICDAYRAKKDWFC